MKYVIWFSLSLLAHIKFHVVSSFFSSLLCCCRLSFGCTKTKVSYILMSYHKKNPVIISMLAAFAKITNQLKQHEHEHVREHMYERAYARNTHNYEFSFMNFCVIYIFNYIFVAAVVVVVAVAVAVLYVLLYNKRESVCTLSSQIEYAEREQPQCTAQNFMPLYRRLF